MEKLHKSINKLDHERFRFRAILGTLTLFIGLLSLILSVIDLFQEKPTIYNYNESEGGLKIENPLWSSSGKGFWVGLVLITTGIVGVLSSREGTRTSIIAFTVLSIVSTVLSFYMMTTSAIPIQNYMKASANSKVHWQLNELVLSSILMVVGTLGFMVGTISSIFSCIHANCCVDQRDLCLTNTNSAQATSRISSSMRYPTVSLSHMSYSYQQSNFRMPL